MNISLICISCLAILVILLSINVVINRAKTKTLFGYTASPEDQLYKAVRAHGNAIEYVPIVALVIYILGRESQPVWVLICMVLFVVARVLAALGLLLSQSLNKFNIMRFVGTSVSMITGIALSVALLIGGLNA